MTNTEPTAVAPASTDNAQDGSDSADYDSNPPAEDPRGEATESADAPVEEEGETSLA